MAGAVTLLTVSGDNHAANGLRSNYSDEEVLNYGEHLGAPSTTGRL